MDTDEPKDPATERADKCFEELIQYAHMAALQDNAAGYNVAINALKYVASVLNPAKYGTKVVSNNGATEGYVLDTGIRREGDPGHIQAGAFPHETSRTTAIPDQDRELGGQGHANDVGLDL
jgi:hypothetical protein